MVWEKLFEVFHPTTRVGKGDAFDSETRTVGKLAGGVPDRDGDVTVGPAEAGRDVLRAGASAGSPFAGTDVGLR